MTCPMDISAREAQVSASSAPRFESSWGRLGLGLGIFRVPPRGWIRFRLGNLGETLDANTTAARLFVRGSGNGQPWATHGGEADSYWKTNKGRQLFKQHYVAHTKVGALALVAGTLLGPLYWEFWELDEAER